MFSNLSDNYYDVISPADIEVANDSTDAFITTNVTNDNTSTENKLVKSKSRDKTHRKKLRKQLQKTEVSSNPCPTGRHLKSHPLADLDSENIGLTAVALSLFAVSREGTREGLSDNSLSQDLDISNTHQKKRIKVTEPIKSAPTDILKQPERYLDPSTKPVKARLLEGRLKQSYKMVPSEDGTVQRVIQHQYVVNSRLGKRSRIAHVNPASGCISPTDSIITSEGLNALPSKPVIPSLESDEYVFDSDEYRKWRTMYRFNFDAAATALNHKCKHYATQDRSFTEMKPGELRDKMIWMFPPIASATEFLTHFEKIRQEQPDSTSAVILLPRILGPGNQYRHLLTKYKKLHTYPRGTYLFQVVNPDTLEITVAKPTTVLYDLYLADSTVEDRQEHSVNNIRANRGTENVTSTEDKQTNKHTNDAENITTTENGSEIKVAKYKPHQARFQNEIILETTNSCEDDLLVIRTPTRFDPALKSLVDSGATREFCNEEYVRRKKLHTHQLKQPLRVRLADGSMSLSRTGITLTVDIGKTTVEREFVVTRLSGPYDLILGYSFLKDYNPTINWSEGSLSIPASGVLNAIVTKRTSDVKLLSGKQMTRLLKKEQNLLEKRKNLPLREIDTNTSNLRVYLSSLRPISDSEIKEETLSGVQGWDEETDVSIKIGQVQTDFGSEHTKSLQKILATHSDALKPLLTLPKQRPGYDMSIDYDGPTPHAKVYRMSPRELEELKVQLKDYLDRGWIRPSTSDFSSGILFATKPGTNKLRLCSDFRQLNTYTKRIGYSLPNIDSILDKLGSNSCFTALDLASGYHQLRVKDYPNGGVYDPNTGAEIKGSDVHKTCIATQYGNYEWLVTPFGLTNAPSVYQKFVNSIMDPIRRPWLAVYLDDILIFSSTPEEHLQHINEVFSVLVQNELYVRFEKCLFLRHSLDYLGFSVQGRTETTPGGITPSKTKIAAVQDWPVPSTVREVQSFLGFVNFYRRFIPSYASIAAPLYRLTEKDTLYSWGEEENNAFRTLKLRLTSSPLLVSPRTGPTERFVLSTDASNKGIGAVLLQEQPDGSLRPCSYYAKTLNKAQRNYPIYDQELLAISAALHEYRIFIEGCAHVTIITDHRPLTYLPKQKDIMRRHVPWVTVISQYLPYLTIVYRKGELNDSDALSRRSDLMQLTEEHIEKHPELKAKFEAYDAGVFEQELEDLAVSLSGMSHLQVDKKLTADIIEGYKYDRAFNGTSTPAGAIIDQNGLYWIADKIYVPRLQSLYQRIISEFHTVSGHPDYTRTAANILRSFYWPTVHKDTKSFVKLCPVCQRIKPRTQKPHGSLMPLPVPSRPWESVSMDFITGLPNIDGYDAILTVVCTLTKQSHFIPCSKTINSRQLAKTFLDNVYRLHGLPRFLIGDRDTRYTSAFFKSLMSDLKTTLSLSTAYHPQSDGNTERVHRTIEQILRSFVHEDHYEWLTNLPLAEFAYNNNVHSSTGFSPFESNYGFSPRTPLNLIEPPMDSNQTQKESDDYLHRLLTVHQLIIEQLKISKEMQKHHADKRSKPMEFNIDDYVLLSTQHLKMLDNPSKKFKKRFIGPYLITKKISSQAYELKLPSTMKVHPVFHISLLKEYHSADPANDVPDNVPSTNDYVYGDDFYHVSMIMDHKTAEYPQKYAKGPALLFKVRWENYGPSKDSWEPYINVKRTDQFQSYLKSSDKFRLLLKSTEYSKLRTRYPSRFPDLL